MFLLDTNVVSELRKAKSGRADPNVTAWAARQPAGSLYLSAITILELEMGGSGCYFAGLGRGACSSGILRADFAGGYCRRPTMCRSARPRPSQRPGCFDRRYGHRSWSDHGHAEFG